MAEPVEAVLFDVDDTLCEYRRSVPEVLSLAFADVGVEPFFAAEDYYAAFDDFVEESDGIDDLRRRCFERLSADAGRDPDLGRAVADAYAAERDQTDVEWLPGARTAFEAICERYAVAAVTNGAPGMQSKKLDALGILDRFETVVHAGHDAPAKPDPAPFHRALDALGTPAERAVKVGNSLDNDVAGAHAAGLRSVWLDRDGVADPDPEPHHRIESMDELTAEPWAD